MLINPILASSARRRMRSWKTPLILLLFGAALLGIAFVTALMPLMGESMTISSARNGLDSYIVLVCAEFALIVLVAPAMTAGSIAGERERQTLEMLLVTNTGSFRIALGKLLESLGYLYRETDQNDRRQNNLYLTDKGRELVPVIRAYMAQWGRTITAGLTDQERSTLIALLTKVTEQNRKQPR